MTLPCIFSTLASAAETIWRRLRLGIVLDNEEETVQIDTACVVRLLGPVGVQRLLLAFLRCEMPV